MKQLLIFNSRDELLRMDVDNIVYFEANGNYTIVMSVNKLKACVGLNLSKTEEALNRQLGEQAQRFMRVGKRFIVNLNFVYSINVAKQHLILSDMRNFAFQLPISKDALRMMKELMIHKSMKS
jgi:DNA-binding LytR/AlgR family response regulator